MKTVRKAMDKIKYAWLVLVLAGGIISLSFVDHYFEISKHIEIFTAVYKELNANYVDDVEPAKLMRTGIDAILNSLDPYTNFISESQVEDYRFQTTGKYGGIGARIRKQGEYVLITEPYEGFPAHEAGLIAGDKIIEINGKSAKDKNSEEVSKLLRGSPDTDVDILISRPPTNEQIQITLTRKEIKIKSVPYYGMVSEDIGYIKLTSFTQRSGRDVRDALVSLKKKHKLTGVVFDLRGNQGGLLDEAINVSNVFIEKGQQIVFTKGKIKDSDKSYKTLNIPVDKDIRVVVLTNHASASASEIVSGAIQDLDRGVLIGQTTYGKGLVQTTRPLVYNTRLKVTIAKYYIPSGRCIQAIDYSNKGIDGEAEKMPDSLRTEFKTMNGRSVFDGAGVDPDIELEPRKYSKIAMSLMSHNLIFDFATQFHYENKTIADARSFEVTDEIYNVFMEYISDKEFDYTTKSEKLLREFEDNTQKEKYYDAIKENIDLLRSKMLHDKDKDLLKFKVGIKRLIKGEIVSRYYYQNGRIEAFFDGDEELLKGIEVLQNGDTYDSLLK